MAQPSPSFPFNTTTATIMWTTTTTSTPINDSSNITGVEDDSKPGPLVSLTVPLLMFSTGVLGNVLALVLLWLSRRESARSVFYRLVAGLAVTDLFGTTAVSPVTLLVYSNDLQWVGGQPLCNYFSFMLIFAGLATVLVVLCMAVERFLAILHPYFYERHAAPEKVKLLLGAIWLVAGLIAALPLVNVGRNVRQYPGSWCFFDFYSDRVVDKVFSLFYASIGLLVIAATAVCNVAVMAVLLRMRRVSKNIGKTSEGRTLNMTSEMQMIFFLAGIILVFATCYSPLMVRVIINVSKTMPTSVGADLMAIRLASLNQILDPWVYLLFRRRLVVLLYSACRSVSPLSNPPTMKGLRSEYSPRNSPSLRLAKNGRYPAAGQGGERDSVRSTRSAESPQPSGVEALSRAVGQSGSRASLIVRSDCNGHCTLELVQDGVGKDGDVLDSAAVRCTEESAARDVETGSKRSSVNAERQDARGISPNASDAAAVDVEHGQEVSDKPLDSTGGSAVQHKRSSLMNEAEFSLQNNGVAIPNGNLPPTTAGVLREGKSTLPSSSTWPVVCRHGKQAVVQNSDTVHGDCLPLLNAPCPQCKRTSGEFSFV